MSSKEECAAYFKERPEYGRILDLMQKKWESLGRTAGKVILRGAAEKERSALEQFLGVSVPEEDIAISLSEFEKALQETRYAPVSLKELLEAYFDKPLRSSREKKRSQKSREENFWADLRLEVEKTEPDSGEMTEWIREMQEQKNGGYFTVMKEYRKSEAAAKELFLQAARCLCLCRRSMDTEEEGYVPGIRLAVLAAKATGNPHALDRQTSAGALFSYGLCRRTGCEMPRNAQMWKALYKENGILVDELSSTVAAYGIHLKTENGLHPAYEGYLAQKEPCIISLANLDCAESAWGQTDRIYIVENEMVFSELLGRVGDYKATVLCTSGQPRTAAYELMKLLCHGDHTFYYAGDLDPEGLDIAERIWRGFPERVHIWRMSGQDYEKAMSEESISERRLEILKGLSHPALVKTAERIRRHKKAGYQELLMEDMARDIISG